MIESLITMPDRPKMPKIEVRVSLPAEERGQLATLQRLLIKTPRGDFVPLTSVARWESRRGFEALRHADSQLAVEVTAEVDKSTGNPNEINATLREEILPGLSDKYGINYSFEGRAAEQRLFEHVDPEPGLARTGHADDAAVGR